MKGFFVVGAKLIGIYHLFAAFSFFANSAVGGDHVMGRGASLISGCVWLIPSLFLIFKTEWIAQLVGVNQTSSVASSASKETLLSVGIILIGLFVLLSKFNYLFSLVAFMRQEGHGAPWRGIIYNFIPLVISLVFIFNSAGIVGFIQKHESRAS